MERRPSLADLDERNGEARRDAQYPRTEPRPHPAEATHDAIKQPISCLSCHHSPSCSVRRLAPAQSPRSAPPGGPGASSGSGQRPATGARSQPRELPRWLAGNRGSQPLVPLAGRLIRAKGTSWDRKPCCGGASIARVSMPSIKHSGWAVARQLWSCQSQATALPPTPSAPAYAGWVNAVVEVVKSNGLPLRR